MASQSLSEDTIDDLLYFSRTAEIAELQTTLAQAAEELATTPHNILLVARDGFTGNTALHMAAANGHQEIIKLLLSFEPNAHASEPRVTGIEQGSPALINMRNDNGNTPLHWAALNGHLEAVKLLVDVGADLLAKNNAGHDVAYEAELAGKEEVVNWLLSAENYEEARVKEEEGDAAEAEEPEAGKDEESTG